MGPRVYSLWLSLLLSSLLLLPFLSQATFSDPSGLRPFGLLESFGSFKHLEGSKKGEKREGIKKVKRYLQRHGYLESNDEVDDDVDFDDSIESSLKAFQRFHHLDPTGILDEPTAALMSRATCGYPDHHPDYVPSTLKWPRDQMHLHYIVFPGSLPEQPFTNGLDAWAAVSNFTFERVRDEARAKIRVTVEPIDGPRQLFGRYNPSLINPYFVLDEEDTWSADGSADSYDLETAATHVIGHLLGLEHSKDQGALMYRKIPFGESKKLTQDDIDGIRAIYY